MIVREAYRNVTHRVCLAHWDGRKPLPEDAPALGPVEDARESEGCEFCGTGAAEDDSVHLLVDALWAVTDAQREVRRGAESGLLDLSELKAKWRAAVEAARKAGATEDDIRVAEDRGRK